MRLDSIFNQTFRDFEVILLDDASTDNSVDILMAYENDAQVSHIIINKNNSGSPFKQWQKGIELAKGDYIWIAESDDYCENTFLQRIWDFKEKESGGLGVIYAQSIDINEKGEHLQNRIEVTNRFNPNIWVANFTRDGKDFIKNFLKDHNVIPNASAVVFRKDLVNSSIFTEKMLQMKMCGDWLFWIKICAGSNVGFIAEPLNFFRMHPETSRNVRNRKSKILRLLEESVIRRFLYNKHKLNQKLEIDNLYANWYGHFSIRQVTSPIFHKILIHKYSYLRFLYQFLLKKKHAK